MGKALTYIGAFFLLVLSALLIVPQVVDWNRYRGTFEEEASRVLGREVRVGGKVNLSLLPSPQVHFEKIRISDNAGTLGEPFFRAESFNMGLAVAPLLRGALEATEVELRSPVLTLAIDGEGRGNWRDIVMAPGALAILPAEVRLKAVQISNGTIAVRRSGENELVRLTAINGELSGDNLEGPYRFRGELAWDGQPREVRVSTAAPDADGATRFKVYVRVPASGSTYTVDGRMADLGTKPRLDGELVARIPLPASAAASPAQRKADPDRDVLDLRSKIQGDVFGVALPDVAMSLDQGAQPQLVTGRGEASWRDGLRLKLALDSKWIDLDKISGNAAGVGPGGAVEQLLPTLVSLLPAEGQVDARVAIEQANLGGDAASDIRLQIERFRGPMQVRELQVTLPGATRLDLNGTLEFQTVARSFKGDLSVRGTSLARFLGWAVKGQSLVDATRHDGAFAIAGRLALDDKRVELASLSAEVLGGAQLSGTVGYGWAGRKSIEARLEGAQLDLASIVPGAFDPAAVKSLLWPEAFPRAAEAGTGAGMLAAFDPKTTDARIAIRSGEVSDGTRTLRDVDASFAVEQGKLQISAVRFTTAEGLRLETEGEIKDVTGAQRKGTLGGLVAAASSPALESLLRWLDAVPTGSEERPGRLDGALPLRLAGSLRLGDRANGSTDLALDGLVRGSRAIARFKADGGPAAWRDGMVEATGSIESSEVGLAVAEMLLGRTSRQAKAQSSTKGGQLTLKAAGIPKSGLVTLAALKGEGVNLAFDGRIVQGLSGAREISGTVSLETARSEPALALIGLGDIPGLGDSALSGRVEVNGSGGKLAVRTAALSVAGTPVSGQLNVQRAENGGASVDGTIRVARIGLPGLLSPLLAAQTSRGQPTQIESIWPDAPFNFAALDKVTGKIRLAVGGLALEPGLEVADTVIDLELAPGQVNVSSLEGRVLGGDLKAKVMIEKAPGGASLAGAIRIDEARLELLAGKSVATGATSGILQFSGRALSPQSLVSVLQGKGEITLAQGQLLRHSPSTVPRAIDAILNAKADSSGDGLRKLLSDGLSAGPVKLGPAKLALSIADGALKVQKLAFETQDARGTLETAVELGTLKFDSEWRMEAKAPPQRGAAAAGKPAAEMPGISIIYVGPLRALASVEPRLQTEAFERVVTLIRMEREVEELERLRREDEERVRREQERQRLIEEERRKAQEADRPVVGTAPPEAAPARPAAPLPPPVTPGAAPETTGATPVGQPTVVGAAGAPTQGTGEAAPGQPPLDFPKRPARPPRPAAQQPKFSPFGSPGLGTN